MKEKHQKLLTNLCLLILLLALIQLIDTNTSYGLTVAINKNRSKIDFARNEIIVKFRKNGHIHPKANGFTGIKSLDKLAVKFAIKKCTRIFQNVYKLTFGVNADVYSVIHAYLNDPNVEYAEPNYIYKIAGKPDDPYYSKQWAHQIIDSESAWNIEVGDSEVLVAVVDTGIDYTHEDLVANYVSLGYDWVNNDTDPMDDHGHGTHCAGIIAATTNNSIGIAGIAQVKIMAEKVLCSGGYGYTDWVANGIIHATNSGANIISMSLGSPTYSELLHDAVKYAYNNGVLLVAAAGNSQTDKRFYPAGYDEVVAVAATDISDNLAWFSNYGEWIEVAAPGVAIYSTLPNNTYGLMSGTSMACPHVAGEAALILSRFPTLTNEDLRFQLHWTTDDIGAPGKDNNFGYGRINLRRAVEAFKPSKNVRIWGLQLNRLVKPQRSQTINVSVLNSGQEPLTNLYVDLIIDGEVDSTRYISNLGSLQCTYFNYVWTPTSDKYYNITVYVRGVSGEEVTEDNKFYERVISRQENIVYVPQDYSWIQKAVAVVPSGYTVQVSTGTYYENVFIDQSNITLIGDNAYTTIIDGEGGIAIYARKDHIRVTRFTLTNSYYAILTTYSSYDVVTDNVFINNTVVGLYSYGGVGFNKFERNIFINCNFALVCQKGSNHNLIRENTMINNRFGVLIYSLGGESNSNIICHNVITHNEVKGIEILGGHNNIVHSNTIAYNNIGLNLESRVSNTTIYLNSFIANDNHTDIDSEVTDVKWDNETVGNYWSDYNGTDLNNDGIGDTPYQINEANIDYYPLVTPPQPTYDKTAVNVYYTLPYGATAIYPGWKVNVTITVKNNGLITDSFHLIVYYNNTIGTAKMVYNASTNMEITETLVWTTTSVSAGTRGLNYTIYGGADIAGDPNVEDNKVADGVLRVRYPGDANDDGKVDMRDIALACRLYGTSYGDPEYDWQADFNGDGKIDMRDIAIACQNFGHEG